MTPLRLLTGGAGYTFVQVTEPKTSALQFRANESAELRVAVCGTCGYVEHFIEDATRLWKYWQKGYR
ncbi:nucleic acid-binding protein [Spirosoma soli]|uniref:Nucleic acid-binding protein n=1 Tax=Spirosoma soli TaxID=1770529 RepID=A0ABW5MA38_9BACT